MKQLFQAISTFLFGTKCYAVIIGERGSGDRYYIASAIHHTKEEAAAHRRRIEQTRTFVYIDTVTSSWRAAR